MNFLRYRVEDGDTLEVAYGKAYKSKATKNNQRIEGCKLLQRIVKKAGSWREVFTLYDVGPERMIKTFAEALGANTITIRGEKEVEYPDHRARIAAAKEILKIHGIGEENINVNVDVTAKDVALNQPYIEMVAETMKKYREDAKKEDESRNESTD